MNTPPQPSGLRAAMTVIISHMRACGMKEFRLACADSVPDSASGTLLNKRPEQDEASGNALADMLERICLGECFAEVLAGLVEEMKAYHEKGVTFIMPDGDGQNRIPKGGKFPPHGFIQHTGENISILRKVLGRLDASAVPDRLRERMACIDRYDREYMTRKIAAQDVKKGYVCIKARF